jgi:biopolymer transport protein ExbD
MRFYIRKRRQPPGIIIVALIDVLIVLLIFLMVTTSFNRQPSLKLSLPESSTAQKSGVNQAPPLVIIIEPTGGYRMGLEAKPVTPDQLKAGLKTAVAKNPQIKVAHQCR